MRKKTLACKTPRSCSTSAVSRRPTSVDQVAAVSNSAPDRCDDDHKSEHRDRGSPEIFIQERPKLNRLEKHRCIKCDKVGKMLVCTEIGCPIAIHEDCLIPRANFDDVGNFYCPYCSYKKAVAKVQRLRKRAISAKDELSKFLKVAAVDVVSGKEHEYENIEKKGTAPPCSEDKSQHADEISLQNDQLNQHINDKVATVSEKCNLKVKGNEKTHQVRVLPNTTVRKEHKKTVSPEKTKKADEESTKEDAFEFNDGENVENESDESNSKSASEGSEDVEQNDSASKPITHVTKNFSYEKKEENVFPSHGKRKRLMWTSEEERMLKDGVQIFSDPNKKNLPWRKILQFGSHVFHQTRAPTDLQNKWKNMTKKN